MMNTVDYLLKYIGQEKIEEVEMYLSEEITKPYRVFQDTDEINEYLGIYLEDFVSRLDMEEQKKIREYTGLSFRKINSVLRRIWNYELNGKLTPEIKEEALKSAESIRHILFKSKDLPMAIKAYRGVSLSSFYQYGVTRMNELTNLIGKYVYEEAFVSTSLIRNSSFFYNQTEWGEKATIEIEYLLPEGSDDGALINCDSLSYSPFQNEYLINSGALLKILDVEVAPDSKTAKMKMILVPQKVWNPKDYEMERKVGMEK